MKSWPYFKYWQSLTLSAAVTAIPPLVASFVLHCRCRCRCRRCWMGGLRIIKELRTTGPGDGAHVTSQRWSIPWQRLMCGSLTTTDKAKGLFIVEWIFGMLEAISWTVWSKDMKVVRAESWAGAKNVSWSLVVFCTNNSPRSRLSRNCLSFSCFYFSTTAKRRGRK